MGAQNDLHVRVVNAIFYPTFPRREPPPRGSLKPYMQLSTETIITSLESANTEFSIQGYEGQKEKARSININR